MSNILDHLDNLTKQGEDYIWRTARDAVAEIERLRAVNAALLAALERIAEDTGSPDAIDALALAKGEKP